MEENKIVLTIEGLTKLEKEQVRLLQVERDQVIEELKAARAQGDLSENADYDAARDRQARIEATIKQNDYMLGNYELIDAKEKTSKDKLQAEFEELRAERVTVTDAVTAAKRKGLTSENEELEDALGKLIEIETRLKVIEFLLTQKSSDSKSKGKKVVKLGSLVTIETLDEHQIEKYTIVGTVEADPLNGKISNETPLAIALLDKKVDETVTVYVAKPYKVKIMEID